MPATQFGIWPVLDLPAGSPENGNDATKPNVAPPSVDRSTRTENAPASPFPLFETVKRVTFSPPITRSGRGQVRPERVSELLASSDSLTAFPGSTFAVRVPAVHTGNVTAWKPPAFRPGTGNEPRPETDTVVAVDGAAPLFFTVTPVAERLLTTRSGSGQVSPGAVSLLLASSDSLTRF